MAELDPDMRPQADGNFITYSRGNTPDVSWGGLFQDAATMLTTGVRALNEVVVENAREGFTRAADDIRNVFTGRQDAQAGLGAGSQAGGAGTSTTGPNTPRELQDYEQRLRSLGDAYRGGNLRESHYWAMLDLEARRQRQRFPGHRGEIDRMVQEVVGATPANALVRELRQEALVTGDRTRQNDEYWLRQGTEHGAPSAINYAELQRQGRTPPWQQLQAETAYIQANNASVRTEQAQIALDAGRGTRDQRRAEDGARRDLMTQFSLIFQTATGAVPEFERRLSEAQRTGEADPARLAELQTQFITQVRGPAQALFTQVMNGTRPGGEPGTSWSTLIGNQPASQNIEQEYTAMLNRMGEAIGTGDWSMITRLRNQVQAFQNGDVLAALQSSQTARNAVTVREMFGPQIYQNAAIFNEAGRLGPAVREIFQRGIESTIVTGGSLDSLSNVQRTTNPDQRAALLNANINALVGDLANPQQTDRGITQLATVMFGPENRNFLQNHVTNRAEVYQRMVGDQRVATNMQRIRESNPELYNNYRGWVVNNFHSSLRQTAADLNNVIIDPASNASVVFNPTTNQFVAQGMDDGTTPGRIRNVNQVIQGFTTMLRAEGKSDEEIRGLVASQIQRLGVEPNTAAGRTPWGGIVESIINFANRSEFVPDPETVRPEVVGPLSRQGGDRTHFAPILNLIGRGEAGQFGYNQAFGPDRQGIFSESLTNMTIAEVRAFQRETIGNQGRTGVAQGARSSASGRYQFVQQAFDEVVREMNLPPETRFTPAVQDRMATHVLNRMGLSEYIQNPTPEGRTQLINRLSSFWAAIPNARGVGTYDNDAAGNRANIPLAELNRVLDELVRTHGRATR